jgi:hypothetical protein
VGKVGMGGLGAPSCDHSIVVFLDQGRARPAEVKALSLAPLLLAALIPAGCSCAPVGADPALLMSQIVAKERQGLDALKSGDLAAFAGLTADEAVFIDPHGAATKAQVMKNVAEFRLQDYSIEDVKLVPLSDKSGLIAYRLTESGVSHGRQFKAKAYISAVWAERGGNWVCLFSQETAAR